MTDPLFAAFRDVPDYHAGPGPFVGVFKTFDGAVRALYPTTARFREAFREQRKGEWIGPDGFGRVAEIEVGE